MAKRANLTDFVATKPGTVPPPPAAPTPAPKADDRKGQTLRLSVDAWKQLRIMAAEQETTMHDILIAALNAEFKRHGKPEIA